MDTNNPIVWVLGLLIGIAKALIAYVWHRLDKLFDKQAAFEVHATQQFAGKEDIRHINEKLDRLIEVVADKADRQ